MNEIYVITHKDYVFPESNLYVPLIVGANNNNVTLKKKCYYDNIGENISYKNSSFCELTGLYWIYKNSKADIIGLAHYRRYFFKKRYSKSFDDILDTKYISSALKTADIILPKKKYLIDGNIREDYGSHHKSIDLKRCISIIKRKYPDYSDCIDKFLNQKYLYPYNMFIAKRALMNQYCEWLFGVLFELEKDIDISEYDDYNKRIFGFLAERLFNLWVMKNGLRIHESYVLNIEKNRFVERLENDIKHACVLPGINNVTGKAIKAIRKKSKK